MGEETSDVPAHPKRCLDKMEAVVTKLRRTWSFHGLRCRIEGNNGDYSHGSSDQVTPVDAVEPNANFMEPDGPNSTALLVPTRSISFATSRVSYPDHDLQNLRQLHLLCKDSPQEHSP